MPVRGVAAPAIRLLVLDGDHTLWQPLDRVCCSERSLVDRMGWTACGFAPVPGDPDLVVREDGARFRLTPGARAALAGMHAAGIRLALASFNHVAPVRGVLAAFGLLPLFSQVVAAWSTDKAAMLQTILAAEAAAGRPTTPEAVLFVDDDRGDIYRPMATGLGIRFAQMGNPAEVRTFADIARLAGVKPG